MRKCVVLLTGLPNSGKTTLAKALVAKHGGSHINADEVRAAADDWDFSLEGRLRQFNRMKAATEGKKGLVFLDFICPIDAWRKKLNADLVVWMDTIQLSKYEDTNKVFERPVNYDVRISSFDQEMVELVGSKINRTFDNQAPTVQMLGRWQPWHDGHTALFERAIKKTGQVAIMIRDLGDENNPFSLVQTTENIEQGLAKSGWKLNVDYIVLSVPNIVDISYGRKVGYTFTEHDLGEEIHTISATNIRKKMGV
jgi:hypothetical protein